MPVKAWGGGRLKPLADMSAKNAYLVGISVRGERALSDNNISCIDAIFKASY